MTIGDTELMALARAIVADDRSAVETLVGGTPELATLAFKDGATRQAAPAHFLAEIGHYVYAGDTALHVAAAAHRPELVRRLIGQGAEVSARNRRGAEPLHYAADGRPNSSGWVPAAQAETIVVLLGAGVDPDARDKSGVAALHRAVRTRSAAAVAALLEGGADPTAKNGSGSTPLSLAIQTTGKSGSGSPEAKAQQAEIVALLQARGA